MPAATEPAPLGEDPRSSRWDLVLVLVMGGALLLFGWVDTRSHLVSRHKLAYTFSMNARPGGERVGPVQEFFRNADGDYARLENFTALERWDRLTYRHILGAVSTLEIVSTHLQGRLSFKFENRIADQDIAVACNGQPLEQMTHLPEGVIYRTYPLVLHPGSNVVTFTCRRYNHAGAENAPGDSRPIAGTFDALDLLLE